MYYNQDQCKVDDGYGPGVDLNRNYEWAFAQDNEGSSGEPCEEDYRGPHPFSEPETRAIRDFLIENNKVKFAINFHAYGNLMIQPFNADDIENANLNKPEYSHAKTFYNELRKSHVAPERNEQGNGQQTIKYTANGEASDYMLGERKIIALSPELGTSNDKSNDFLISSKEVLA